MLVALILIIGGRSQQLHDVHAHLDTSQVDTHVLHAADTMKTINGIPYI